MIDEYQGLAWENSSKGDWEHYSQPWYGYTKAEFKRSWDYCDTKWQSMGSEASFFRRREDDE